MDESSRKITFHVPGKPIPQSRPRFARRGNHVATYDAAPAKDYKSWVKTCALNAMAVEQVTLIPREIALAMNLTVNIERPKSKKNAVYVTVKPDVDNLAKGILDSLESILYAADQQIITLTVSKHYSDCPGVIISVTEVI